MANAVLPPDDGLERELATLGRQLVFPPEPDLAPAVRARIARQSTSATTWRARIIPLRRWAALAAAGAVVAIVTMAALLPNARETIADRLGLRGAEITLEPTTTAQTAPAALALGTPVTLDAALAHLQYRPFLPPAALGPPDAVYLLEPPLGGQLSYVYLPDAALPEAAGSGVGLLVSQFRGDINESFIAKQLPEGSSLEVVDVHGSTGFWISGAPHVFAYEDPNGEIRQETLRLAGNVLLWEVDGLTVRIESALPRDEVLAIARSMTR